MAGTVGGIQVFPGDSIWNTPIWSMPVHAQSATWISMLGGSSYLWPARPYNDPNFPYQGFPYVLVDGTQAFVTINITGFPLQSDPGPYPIPSNAPIEGYTGDNHVVVIDTANHTLYELDSASVNQDGSWNCYTAAKWDLTSNNLRPLNWTSADAAGLPIFPGLVRWDEVATGAITHALRGAVQHTHTGFLWPARHDADIGGTTGYPPMGTRFRLKATKDISGFSATNQIILQALKSYGWFVADNIGGSGGFFDLSCSPTNTQFTTDLLALGNIHLSDFEAVDESSLQVSANSGQAVQITTPFVTTQRRDNLFTITRRDNMTNTTRRDNLAATTRRDNQATAVRRDNQVNTATRDNTVATTRRN